MNDLLVARDLHKYYEQGRLIVPVLKGVNVAINEGEVLVVMGPSGVGKSTLLHLLGLLDTPTDGEITYNGTSLTSLPQAERSRLRNREFGFIFQMFHLLPDLDAVENVMLPVMITSGVWEWSGIKAETRERAAALLTQVGLAPRLKHRPSELSGGERQRVAIARSLICRPRIVFCDEPTGNLDESTTQQINELIWQLNRDTGQTFVIVTHNEALARHAHRVAHMHDGRVADIETR